MNVTEILQRVEEVNGSSEYWFVRTDYGKLFDEFYYGGYIAIGWDYVTQSLLKNVDAESVKEQIAARENFNLETAYGRGQASMVYNKIQNFVGLKESDFIIMPSRNSSRLAFGRILDSQTYDEVEAKSFIKRRKVQWIKIRNMDDLHPVFYQVKSNRHTISNVSGYSKFIDREIGNLFKKGLNTHYVLKVEKEEDINFNELKSLIDNVDKLLLEIDTTLEFDENFEDFYVKVNLQSKGTLELIKDGKSLAILAYLLFMSSCGKLDDCRDERINELVTNNKVLIENTTADIDTLKVNTDELTKPFENGN